MNCIHYKDGYRYQLLRPHVGKTAIRPESTITTDYLALDLDGNLTISAGYAWDGASGPTVDSKSSMRASLGHDAKYQLMRLGLIDADKWRPVADDEFLVECKEDGMWSWRAWLWYQAVRTFASGAAEKGAESREMCAPCDCDANLP